MNEPTEPPPPPPPSPSSPPPGPGASPPPPLDPLTADREALREPRRVSPFGPLFLAWAVIRQLGIVNIGIFTALISTGNIQLLGIAGSVLVLVVGFVRWLRFTYELETTDEGDQLITLSGVLARNRTSVPLDRVQSVSTRQNLMHRVFNLVEVNVQTAGSVGSEVELTAVRPDVAERIRRLSTVTSTSGSIETASARPDGAPPPPPEADPLLRRSVRDILVVAFTRNPILLLAPIPLAAALGAELGDLLSGFSDEAGEALEGVADSVTGVIILVIVVLVISMAASTFFVLLRLHDLRLFVDGAGLRRLAGLISRTEVTASVERVQLVGVQRNLLERMVGHHEVVLPLAGGGAGVQVAGAVPTAIDLPGTERSELERIADAVFGPNRDAEIGHDDRFGISPLAVRRWTLWIGVVPVVAVIAGSWWLIGVWALLALVWLPVVAYAAMRRQRSWSWSLGPETLRLRYGVLTTVERTMPVRKTQNVIVRRGIFHRRFGLADLRVRTASNVQMVVPMLPLAEAHAVRDELLYRAESDPRPFM